MADDQRPNPESSAVLPRHRAVALAVVVVLVVVVVAIAVGARRAARSTGSPSVPVSTATESAGPEPAGEHPHVGPALQPIPASGCATGPRRVLRVLQFNIRAGIDDQGEVGLTRIAAEIEAAHPDLVSLNEVDDGTRRSGGADEPSYLSRATGLRAIFGPTLLGYDGGRFGNVILSRYPVLESHDVPLPLVSSSEPRALLTTTVRVGRRTVSFSSVHLSAGRATEADRVLEAEAVGRVLRRAQHPTIVAGDLNSERSDLPVQILRQYLLDAQDQTGTGSGDTVPEPEPSRGIDYVLYDNHFASVAGSTEVLPSAVSDHRSVVTELVLRPTRAC